MTRHRGILASERRRTERAQFCRNLSAGELHNNLNFVHIPPVEAPHGRAAHEVELRIEQNK